MPEGAPGDVTLVLKAAAGGDRVAAERLLPLVYDELRRLAKARLARTPPGNTLQPTALVHEAYIKAVGEADPGWDGRGHFFAAAARAMRNILVDQARRKAAVKHGGGGRREQLDSDDLAIESPTGGDVLALDEALTRLEQDDARKAQVVMLRFFGGLSNEQIAQALGISLPTVERDWRFARSWLQQQLGASVEP